VQYGQRISAQLLGDWQLTGHEQRRASPSGGTARVLLPEPTQATLVALLDGLPNAHQRSRLGQRDPLEGEPWVHGDIDQPVCGSGSK
jgi:hypothetical protein